MNSDVECLRFLFKYLVDKRAKQKEAHDKELAERQKIWNREYYNSHKEQWRGYGGKWRREHSDNLNANAKRWREKNPDKARLFRKHRDYRERNAEGKFTLEEWNAKLEEYNYRCAYCGCELNTETITIDHVIPIVRGGTNYIDNLVPACCSCNSRKHTKTAEEYLAILQGN